MLKVSLNLQIPVLIYPYTYLYIICSNNKRILIFPHCVGYSSHSQWPLTGYTNFADWAV